MRLLIPRFDVVFSDLAKQVDSAALPTPKKNSSLLTLLSLYVGAWPFDEAFYLKRYPDVARAVSDGYYHDGWTHFCHVGYIEGRLPMVPAFDSVWYLDTYADVAGTIIDRTFINALAHFNSVGYREGRLPCKPTVDAKWYGPRYLPGGSIGECLQHFIRSGYVSGALPVPPR